MRKPEYFSPSSISTFQTDLDEFYLRYLCETRIPRPPQTQPMSVGSAFDAFVKAALHDLLCDPNPQFELKVLFDSQVEKHNREWAWKAGKEVFKCYQDSGAYADLLIELQKGMSTPRFEITVKRTIDGVPLLGKPDAYFVNRLGHPVILDWKVNGWCSQRTTSPKPGYLRIRDGHGDLSKSKGPHKMCMPHELNGMRINMGSTLDIIDKTWGTQLAIYSWLCGSKVGEPTICCIDQIVGPPEKCRIAEHRSIISFEFQKGVIDLAKHIVDIIESGHIFREMSEQDSIERCRALDLTAQGLSIAYKSDDPREQAFRNMLR